MNTQPDNKEAARLEAINLELCQKIVDLETEVERKNKTVADFMAENEALKAELSGTTTTDTGQATAPVEKHKAGGTESTDRGLFFERLNEAAANLKKKREVRTSWKNY